MLYSHGETEPGRISTWLAIRMKFNIGFMGTRLSPIVMVKRGPLVTLEEGTLGSTPRFRYQNYTALSPARVAPTL